MPHIKPISFKGLPVNNAHHVITGRKTNSYIVNNIREFVHEIIFTVFTDDTYQHELTKKHVQFTNETETFTLKEYYIETGKEEYFEGATKTIGG
jgi:hypothetical protein